MPYSILYKDPAESLSYDLDWTAWLDGDTITASAWDVPAGLTLAGSSSTGTAATAVLSGGTLGAFHAVSNLIETAAGRRTKRTFVVRLTSK